jgi:hypothetical protein
MAYPHTAPHGKHFNETSAICFGVSRLALTGKASFASPCITSVTLTLIDEKKAHWGLGLANSLHREMIGLIRFDNFQALFYPFQAFSMLVELLVEYGNIGVE